MEFFEVARTDDRIYYARQHFNGTWTLKLCNATGQTLGFERFEVYADLAAYLETRTPPQDEDTCALCGGTGTITKGTTDIRVYHCRKCGGTGLSEKYV